MRSKISSELHDDFKSLELSDFNKKYFSSKIYQFKKRIQENRSLPYTVIPENTPKLYLRFKNGKLDKFTNLSTFAANLHYIKKLNKSISYDSMLCASAWLLYNYYDIEMDYLQKDYVIAQSIKVAESDKCECQMDNRKFMVNKNYDWPSMGVTNEKQKIALCRRMYNGELFHKYYDASKSDAENLEYMIQMGMDISRRTYFRMKKDNAHKPSMEERLRIFSYYSNRSKQEIMSLMKISQATYYRLKKESENRNGTFEKIESLQNTENQYSYEDSVGTFEKTCDTNNEVSQKCHLDNNIIINNIIRNNIIEENKETSIPSDYTPIIEKENIKDESFKLFTKEKATPYVRGGGFSFSVVEDDKQNAIQDSNETAIQTESSLPSDYKPIFDGIDDSTRKQILLDNEKMKSDMESTKDNPAIQDKFLNVLDDLIKSW